MLGYFVKKCKSYLRNCQSKLNRVTKVIFSLDIYTYSNLVFYAGCIVVSEQKSSMHSYKLSYWFHEMATIETNGQTSISYTCSCVYVCVIGFCNVGRFLHCDNLIFAKNVRLRCKESRRLVGLLTVGDFVKTCWI